LIGPDAVSAGETFTMALMGRRPPVLRVGEDTQGVYSTILVRALPNGWRFGLPTEVFLTVGGEHFEARGVPPMFGFLFSPRPTSRPDVMAHWSAQSRSSLAGDTDRWQTPRCDRATVAPPCNNAPGVTE
jgi:hypothetical protein